MMRWACEVWRHVPSDPAHFVWRSAKRAFILLRALRSAKSVAYWMSHSAVLMLALLFASGIQRSSRPVSQSFELAHDLRGMFLLIVVLDMAVSEKLQQTAITEVFPNASSVQNGASNYSVFSVNVLNDRAGNLALGLASWALNWRARTLDGFSNKMARSVRYSPQRVYSGWPCLNGPSDHEPAALNTSRPAGSTKTEQLNADGSTT